MSLAKLGYKPAVRGTTYNSVPMNPNGFIALGNDTAATTKTLQFTAANADNSQQTNQQLISTFMNFVPNAKFVTNARMRVIWEV